MEFEGKWKVKAALKFGDEGTSWVSADEIAALEKNEENEDYLNLIRMVIIIDDKTFKIYGKFNEEELESIKNDEGVVPDETGMILAEEHPIEFIDGQYKIAVGMDGDETMYATLALDENGDLPYSEMLLLERAE